MMKKLSDVIKKLEKILKPNLRELTVGALTLGALTSGAIGVSAFANQSSIDVAALKAMEETEINHIFGDRNLKSQLTQSFLSAQSDECLWYARLLKSIEVKNLDEYILQTLE